MDCDFFLGIRETAVDIGVSTPKATDRVPFGSGGLKEVIEGEDDETGRQEGMVVPRVCPLPCIVVQVTTGVLVPRGGGPDPCGHEPRATVSGAILPKSTGGHAPVNTDEWIRP